MQPSAGYYNLVREQEGCIYHPYLDNAGVPTIGIGTTRYPNGLPVTLKDKPITLQQANEYLFHDSTAATHAVNSYVKEYLRQNQFDALLDLVYNIGAPTFYSSTILKLVNLNPDDLHIANAFRMWNKAHIDGKLMVLDDLVKRREAEIKLYFAGSK